MSSVSTAWLLQKTSVPSNMPTTRMLGEAVLISLPYSSRFSPDHDQEVWRGHTLRALKGGSHLFRLGLQTPELPSFLAVCGNFPLSFNDMCKNAFLGQAQ